MKKAISWLLVLAMLSALAASFAEQAESTEALPEAFDLRSVDTDGDGVGDRCYVPPVRQQNPFGTCWGFAATAASEISILGSILDYDPDAWKSLNLSEKQLAYFTHVPLADESNPQNGEGFVTDGKDAVSVYNTGGNLFLAASSYAQGIGPSKEDNGEYGDLFRYHGREKNTLQRYIDGAYRNFCYSNLDDWSIPEEYRFARDYYLRESVLLPSPAHEYAALGPYEYHPEVNRLIKEQLLLKRGVSIGFMADISRPDQDLSETGIYLNNETWAHYTWENKIANHAVTIIGWDDHYPKENFLADHQPPGDGAWLVRNSWGSGEEEFPNCGEMNWGIPVQKKDENGNPVWKENGDPVMVGSGYFWLSYHDQSLTNPESFVFWDAIAPEYIDQHDYLQVGEVTCKKYDEPVKMANVFAGGHARVLTEISCMTGELDTEVNYAVYLLCDDFTHPEEGLCVSRGNARFAYGGYHRIQLEDQVFLQSRQAYAIVLEMKNQAGQYLTNEAVFGSIPGLPVNPRAVINEKESFLFRSGSWEDYRQVSLENAASSPESAALPEARIYYDNFAIKGYCNYIAGDMAMVPVVLNDNQLVTKEGYNSTKIQLQFRGPSVMEMGNPEIEWMLLNGSEELADFVTQKEGSQILLTARKEGTVYLAVRIRGQESMGTTVLRLEVAPIVPSSAIAVPHENVYTGEPVTPGCMVKTSQGIELEEGTDFTVEYANNVLCGIADLLIHPIGTVGEPLLSHFMIVPGKAEISGLSAGDGTVRVSVADQWATGIGGYDIEYRKEGDINWQVVTLTDGQTEAVLSGLEAGAACEVRARAKVDGVIVLLGLPTVCYGEYSDAVTFTAP